MLFNLLYPVWFVITQLLPISFGAVNDAEIKRIAAINLDFAIRLQIMFLMVRLSYGLTPLVVDGVRTPAEQAALHKQNPKNPLNPGDHGTGSAGDLNFLRNGVIVLRKASPAAAWAEVYQVADFCGIDNGHAFKGYADNNHFFRRKRVFFLF